MYAIVPLTSVGMLMYFLTCLCFISRKLHRPDFTVGWEWLRHIWWAYRWISLSWCVLMPAHEAARVPVRAPLQTATACQPVAQDRWWHHSNVMPRALWPTRVCPAFEYRAKTEASHAGVRPDPVRPTHGDDLRTVPDVNRGLDRLAQPAQVHRETHIRLSAQYHHWRHICESRVSADEREAVPRSQHLNIGSFCHWLKTNHWQGFLRF